MPETPEKRGPIEKSAKGWPINPLGVVALVIFITVAALFIVRPLVERKAPQIIDQQNAAGGRIITPQAGKIVTSDQLTIELFVDKPDEVQEIRLWAKTYADGKWQMIGEITSAPYKLNWRIPESFQNKAIAITSHIYQKDGNIIKDPGGWREGIIILSEK